MLTDNPLRWSQPGTWPWPIYVWLAMVAGSWIWAAWKRYQRAEPPDWPVTDGTVTTTNVVLPKDSFFGQSKNQQTYKAALNYSYSVEGKPYSGLYQCDFPTEGEAREFIRDLVDQAVRVQYHPDKSKKSFISVVAMQSLLQHRAPRLGDDPLVPPAAPLPGWIRPFAWFFVCLSAFGLVFSLWVHINSVLGRQVLPDGFMFLHVGIFVVWFPAVFAAQRLGKGTQFSWKVVLRGAPAWMRYMAFTFFGYAFINFAIFMFRASNQDSADHVSVATWRGFSGHWMVFYTMAMTILYSAVRIKDARVRCAKGHLVSDTAQRCAECGRPVTTY